MAFVETIKIKSTEQETGDYIFSSSDVADMVICKSPDKLQVLVNAIGRDKHVFYVSDGDWSTNDLVMCLLQEYKPAELFFCTYAIRELPIRQLIMAQDRGELTAINMLLDYRAKTRTPEVFQLAAMNANKIVLTNIHAKVTVLKSPFGFISIVGSSNWTANPRVECGVVSLNDKLGNFHINWMQKLLSNGEVFE